MLSGEVFSTLFEISKHFMKRGMQLFFLHESYILVLACSQNLLNTDTSNASNAAVKLDVHAHTFINLLLEPIKESNNYCMTENKLK